MIGALIGDVVGSRFEHHNHKSKDFELLTWDCTPTDDSIMTLAIAKTLLESYPDMTDLGKKATHFMRELGNLYPYAGYGGKFKSWLMSPDPKPYNSWGNGAAMRISPIGYVADDLALVKDWSKAVTEVTHNHPEGLKGAEAVAGAIWCARHHWTKTEIGSFIHENYYSQLFTLDEIREDYSFHVSCQNSVPQAIQAFLESTSFEDAIRNAVSIGGDSDTIACITGGIAGAYYEIPQDLITETYEFFDPFTLHIIKQFNTTFGLN